MQNSLALFIFYVLDRKHSFLGKFGPKHQNCQFKLKFGTKTNWNAEFTGGAQLFCFIPETTFLINEGK